MPRGVLMEVTPGSKWDHVNGNRYEVILLANEHSERSQYPVTVVYKGLNGKVWCRPLPDWHRSMLPAPSAAQQQGTDIYSGIY